MLRLIKQAFTWWNGQTVSTMIYTRMFGQNVGHDEFGNQYYISKAKNGKIKRWVIYNGYADSSKVPARWHTWLHGVVDEIPEEQKGTDKKWMRSHLPNLTGSDSAYRPSGSLSRRKDNAEKKGNYESWSP
tara:strand:- start:158 stop:547 length:390 start_codon:yes stop_codon:yes gene_type:complete